jgi:hypothetical protein
VIAAYAAMEAALGDRPPAQTAREFVAAALARAPAREPAQRLEALFERARYSTEPIGPADVADAGRWLEAVARP